MTGPAKLAAITKALTPANTAGLAMRERLAEKGGRMVCARIMRMCAEISKFVTGHLHCAFGETRKAATGM